MKKNAVTKQIMACPFWCFVVVLLLSEAFGWIYRSLLLDWIESMPESIIIAEVAMSKLYLRIAIGIILVGFIMVVYYGLCKLVSRSNNNN